MKRKICSDENLWNKNESERQDLKPSLHFFLYETIQQDSFYNYSIKNNCKIVVLDNLNQCNVVNFNL